MLSCSFTRVRYAKKWKFPSKDVFYIQSESEFVTATGRRNQLSEVLWILQKLRKSHFFIITNLIHKFRVHSHKLHKIKFLYMFRAVML
jgi:hypothetical protein